MQRPSIRTSLVAGTVALAAVSAIYWQRDAWLNTAEAAEPAAAAPAAKKPLAKPKTGTKAGVKPAAKAAAKPAAKAAPPSDPFNTARRAPAEERYPEAAATDDADIPPARFAGSVSQASDEPVATASDEGAASGEPTEQGSVNFGGVTPRVIIPEEEEGLLGTSDRGDRNPRRLPGRDRYAPADISDQQPVPISDSEVPPAEGYSEPPADDQPLSGAAATDDLGTDLTTDPTADSIPTGPIRREPGRMPAAVADLEASDAGMSGGGISGAGRPGGSQLEGPQSPALTIEKLAPREIQVGKPAIFETRIRNVGTVAAQGVEVRDEVPTGTRLLNATPRPDTSATGGLSWTFGTIKPGDEIVVKMELMPEVEGEVGSVATVHFAAAATVRSVATKPELQLTMTGPREVLIGEPVTLVIKVSNPGSGTATGVVLSQMVPENLEHPAGSELEYVLGELKPGATRELELTLKAAKAGQVVNQLTVQDDRQVSVQDQVQFEILAPELEVSMEGPKRRFLERQATYKVAVSNPGTAPAKDVQLVTYLPPGLKFVGANNAGAYDPQTRTVHWILDELPAQESGEVTWTAVPIEAGEQLVKIHGTAQRGLSAEMEESITVEGVSAILFQIADLADPIEVNGETTYEVRIVNQGSKAATNVRLVVELPPEMKPMDAEGPTQYAVNGQLIEFEQLSKLAPKADTAYRIRAQGLTAGDLRIKAQVYTDDLTNPVTKEESTRVYTDE